MAKGEPREKSAEAEEAEEPESTEPQATFESLGVCAELQDACKALKWTKPTGIQEESIPYLIEGKDVVGLAQTGSGKTGTFAIPIIQALLKNVQPFFSLVIAPARELAIQIAETFESLGSGIGLKSCVLVGGIDMMQQAVALGKRPHVIVGTPGRIIDHLSNTKGFSLKALKVLVLDEADKLLDMDFEQELNQILSVIPKERQTMLFSATMTSKVKKLQRASLHNPVKVEVATKYTTVKTLRQQYIFCPQKFKDTFAVYALNELSGSSAIVFVRTCDACRHLSLTLRNLGFGAVSIHGQMSQPKRLAALHKFKAGERSMLVATDVAARGLDIPDVALVLNYDVPTNSKDYVHRVGRTARAGRSGRSITVVTQYDIELYQKIEANIGMKLEQFPAAKEEAMLFHEKVAEAQRLATRMMREADGGKKGGRKRGIDDDGADQLLGNVGKQFRKR